MKSFKPLPIYLLTLAVCTTAGVAYTAPVHLTILDEDSGQPVPCRIYLKDEAGDPVRAKGLPFWKNHFVCPGKVEVDLGPGNYTFEIDRGPEYLLTRGRLRAAAGKSTVVTNVLRRMVNLAAEGWWSGETHVHRAIAEMALLMRAEDLHVAPVITWWNNANTWKNKSLPADPLLVVDGNRFYHIMAGEDERAGGALLYFNLNQPLPIAGSTREHPSPMKFLRQARQQEGKALWVDIEKPFWWDTPIWAASGLVDSVGIAHNHMQRGGMLENEAWGKNRDRDEFPAPLGNGHWTQLIYYHLLNAGLRLPPSAGSASGVLNNPVGYNRAYVYLGSTLSYEKWWEGLRAGQVFVSNGPLLRCRANGAWPGHVFKAGAGQTVDLRLEMQIDSRDPFSKIEVVQNGRVKQTPSADAQDGEYYRMTLSFTKSGWFLVRVLADVANTFRFASTGPFYVEIGDEPGRISKTSARFFLNWVRDRKKQIKLDEPDQRAAVLSFMNQAEDFWQDRVNQANAE